MIPLLANRNFFPKQQRNNQSPQLVIYWGFVWRQIFSLALPLVSFQTKARKLRLRQSPGLSQRTKDKWRRAGYKGVLCSTIESGLRALRDTRQLTWARVNLTYICIHDRLFSASFGKDLPLKNIQGRMRQFLMLAVIYYLCFSSLSHRPNGKESEILKQEKIWA